MALATMACVERGVVECLRRWFSRELFCNRRNTSQENDMHELFTHVRGDANGFCCIRTGYVSDRRANIKRSIIQANNQNFNIPAIFTPARAMA